MRKDDHMSDYQPQKHIDYDYQDILKYLKRAKIAVVQEKYNLSMNREKNKKFSEDYNLTAKKIENIILNLEVENFCYAVDNGKEEFSHEILYVFCSREELNYFGKYNEVDIYIKFNLIDSAGYLYIISFHKREKSVSFLFK
jgi:hypothetical protein